MLWEAWATKDGSCPVTAVKRCGGSHSQDSRGAVATLVSACWQEGSVQWAGASVSPALAAAQPRACGPGCVTAQPPTRPVAALSVMDAEWLFIPRVTGMAGDLERRKGVLCVLSSASRFFKQ